jgi:nitrous oxidase accessory protein NosD
LTAAAKGTTACDFTDGAGTYPKNAVAVSSDLTLPAKGSEGADEQGYVWKEIEYTSLGGTVEIKEFKGGYRINKIQVGAGQGIDNTKAGQKAVKIFENGQLVIIKNGVKYNAIGVQL